MPTAYSLHIGVNNVDPKHYDELTPLRGAINDATYMKYLAENMFGFNSDNTKLLLNEAAKAEVVLEHLKELAAESEAGDLVLITYSGHGGQVDDPFYTGKRGDEITDETWCLYDRQLLDDELFEAFTSFRSRVRIVVVSDSCHSGTVTKEEVGGKAEEFETQLKLLIDRLPFKAKTLTPNESQLIYAKNNQEVYFPIQEKYKEKKDPAAIKASVQLFAACQDNQFAFDGKENGRFTKTLKGIFKQHRKDWHKMNALQLHEALKKPYGYPTPNYFAYGPNLSEVEQFNPFQLNIKTKIDPTDNPAPVIEVPSPEQINILTAPDTLAETSWELLVEMENPEELRQSILKICPDHLVQIRFPDEVITSNNHCVVEVAPGSFSSPWEAAHHMIEQADRLHLEVAIEPVASENFPVQDDSQLMKTGKVSNSYLHHWPPVTTQTQASLVWHLADTHAQLADARDQVWKKKDAGEIKGNIKIAHIDTGYTPDHPVFRANNFIQRNLAHSFVRHEWKYNRQALDLKNGKVVEMQGHGTATLALLSGWELAPHFTSGQKAGYLGAIPFAEVIPMRISDSVLIFDSANFCNALDYAIRLGCEVVSMSMGGKPSPRMARKINEAYEKGVTIVTAAGNSIVKGLAGIGPKKLVYPARFDRVLAACGVCHNQLPYDFAAQAKYAPGLKSFDAEFMQGNWGPAAHMDTALAAYTPNTPWAVDDPKTPILKNGAGTSSATPQIAAAAALWILSHKKELEDKGYSGTWRQVEAVRHALFTSADNTTFPESKKYYGRGILKAKDALEVGVINIDASMKAPRAETSWGGLLEALDLFINRRRTTGETFGAKQKLAMTIELESLLMDMENKELSDMLSTATSTGNEAGKLEAIATVIEGADRVSGALKRLVVVH